MIRENRQYMEKLKYPTRKFTITGESQRDLALAALKNAPIGIEVVLREPVKVRSMDANALMWVGPLKDMAEQAYVGGRSYSAEVWHEHLKKEYLPEESDERYTKDGYLKWDTGPDGSRILVGSTTQLTKAGFSIYLEQVYAFGASLGVQFTANPREYGG
jgi:hypothetical protein